MSAFFTPAGLSSIGSLASGLGAIAGGFGLGGSKGKSQTSQRANQLLYDRARIKQIVLGAQEAGVHPMYALGNPGGMLPGGSMSKSGVDAGQVGAGIERAFKGAAGIKNAKYRTAMQDLGLRQAEAETRHSEFDADLKQIELRKAQQGAASNNESPTVSPPVVPRSKKVTNLVPHSASKKEPERQAGVAPGWKRYQLANGRYIDMPAHMDPDELASPGMIQMIMRNQGYLKGLDDPKTMTRETHKFLKRLGFKPKRRRKKTGQMGRRRRYP